MRDRFFIVKKETNAKVIGSHYPQCSGLIESYNDESSVSLRSFSLQKGKLIDFIPDLNGIALYKTTKITDLISCSLGIGNDSIISPSFYDILRNYKLSSIQFFDCFLYQMEAKYNYKWAHYIYSLEKFVDYQASEFTHPYDELSNDIKKIKTFEDFENFYQNKDEFGFINAKNVVLKNVELDYFVIGRFNQKLYISEKLKKVLTKNKITGIEYVEADDLQIL